MVFKSVGLFLFSEFTGGGGFINPKMILWQIQLPFYKTWGYNRVTAGCMLLLAYRETFINRNLFCHITGDGICTWIYLKYKLKIG